MKILRSTLLKNFRVKAIALTSGRNICITKATKRINSEQDPKSNTLLKHESFVSENTKFIL